MIIDRFNRKLNIIKAFFANIKKIIPVNIPMNSMPKLRTGDGYFLLYWK